MNKTILVTGGTGFIGSHTVVELLTANYEVIIVDNFENSQPEVLDRIKAITGKSPLLYVLDIRNQDALSQVFNKHKIDAVIHFAALKAVGESTEKPLTYYHNNLTGLLTLLTVMNEYKCKSIIFSSSATVYGLSNTMPITESAPRGNATNPYGQTKVISEQILEDTSKSDSAWKIVILRYFNPIGAHKTGLIGENPNGIPNNLMPYITQVALGKLDFLRVFGNDFNTPDGTGVRDYIHVVDLAKGHLSALKWINNNSGVEIFNLGTGKGYSVLDIVNAFVDATGMKVPYKIVERRAGDIDSVYSNPEKAKNILGWKAENNLFQMCQDAWNWQKNNPEGYASS